MEWIISWISEASEEFLRLFSIVLKVIVRGWQSSFFLSSFKFSTFSHHFCDSWTLLRYISDIIPTPESQFQFSYHGSTKLCWFISNLLKHKPPGFWPHFPGRSMHICWSWLIVSWVQYYHRFASSLSIFWTIYLTFTVVLCCSNLILSPFFFSSSFSENWFQAS